MPINVSSLTTDAQMSDQQFYEFCHTNPELRIERNANGEVIIMLPAFADTGNRNGRIFGQLYIWSEIDGTGEDHSQEKSRPIVGPGKSCI